VNHTALIDRLEASGRAIAQLIRDVPRDQALWRPAPESWSILEVTVHLRDEEREDFRTRLDHVLHKPGVSWPPIDPDGWVTQRAYAEQDLEASLHSFLEERTRSIAWLRGLGSPAWDMSYTHPKFGAMAAGELLGSWAAHDLLHIRQLVRLHYAYVQHLAQPYSVGYAGDW
jgi:hypothetical protein